MPVMTKVLRQNRSTQLEILRSLLGANEAPNASPRLAGHDKALPRRRGRLVARGYDLHLIAVLQLGAQRRHAPIDLGANAAVANLAVHGVCEIDRRRPPRQCDQIALGGEAEDLV